MKKMKFWVSGIIALVIHTQASLAQKVDDERMNRDIEVAENVLSTLIKQEISPQRGMMFGLEIKGSYQPGYGVTFRLPGDYFSPMIVMETVSPGNRTVVWDNGQSYSYSYGEDDDNHDKNKEKEKEDREYKLKEKKEKRKVSLDSARDAYNLKLIKAAKDFVIDYGDFLSQLQPNEKIVVTNRGERNRWGGYMENQKRTHLSIEAVKSDITAFKQGKITRSQALEKVKVVNTESIVEKNPDMELFSSILSRLYRPDLSKTYFTENNLYYETLKDYGVMYYMQVYSSNERDYHRYSMPTIGLDDVDKETRDKRVVELYPKFEKELKENILEYGRTLKSLKDEEVLVFNVTLTKCKDCGIPENIELTVKGSVLKDFGSAKIDQASALSKFTLKKGPNQ